MDLATLIGIIAGFGIIVAAIFVGGSLSTFMDVPSVLIVVGGGMAATLIRFPLSGIAGAFALGGKIAFVHKSKAPTKIIEDLAELSELIRKEGPLGLENAQDRKSVV